MSDFVKLPFEPAPLVRTYHYDVFTLGIIQGHNSLEKITPWLCGRYLNCYYGALGGEKLFATDPVDLWCGEDNIMWRTCLDLPEKPQGISNSEIIELMRLMLKNHHYIIGRYNERYIPGKNAYCEYDYMHDYILYGFDDKRKVFFSVGYMRDGRCRPFEITYEDMYKSILNGLWGKYQFAFMLYNLESRFDLNLDRIAGELFDYVNSVSHRPITVLERNYGMKSIHMLQQTFLEEAEGEIQPYIDMRVTRSLMEHKYMLLFCMKHFAMLGLLPNVDLTLFEDNYNKACIIHNLGIKVNLSSRREGCHRMVEMIDQIMDRETRKLPAILETIQKIV